MGVEDTNVRVAGRSATRGAGWTAPTFAGTWASYGGSEQTVQYRKVGDMVQIRGTATGGTINTAVFTLPTGFRPPAMLDFAAQSGTVEVNAAGVVTLYGSSSTQYRIGFVQFSTSA